MSRLNIRAAQPSYRAGLEDAEVEAGMSETEQAVAVAETTAEMMEIENDVANAARLEDQASGLEDAAEVIENIEAATPGEVQLADIAADLGTAGTDAEVEIFNDVPAGEVASVEAFTGRSIGVEGIKEMARAFWEEVKRLVSKAWEAILKFWRKMTSQVPGVIKAARALRARAEDAAGRTLKSEDKKISCGAAGMALILGDTHPTNAADVMKAVTNMTKVSEIVLDRDAKRAHEGGEKLQDVINDFDMEKASAGLFNACGRVFGSGFGESAACDDPIGSDKRYQNGLTAKKSVLLPGGNILVACKAPRDGDQKSVLAWASELRSQSVAVVYHNDKERKDIAEKDIGTLTLQECKKLADAAEDLAMIVKSFEEKHLRKLEQAANKMKGAGDKVAKQIDKDTKAQAQKEYQAAMRFVTAYANWASSPFNRVAALSLTTCRAAIEIGNKSVSRYKAV